MSRVVVVGSTMIEQLTYAQKLPGPGETLVGTRCAMGYGGKGANQAVMARNLGGEGAVAMVNCLGDPSVDHYAKLYKSRFEELSINVDHIHFSAKGTMTGIAPVWVEASGQNRILVVPGANDELMPEQAAAAVTALSAPVVVGQFEIPQAVTAAAFAAAKLRTGGATTVLNPAPASTIDAALLAVTDWLIPNESEFELLAGSPPTDAAIAKFAAEVGVRVLVTLGADGVALFAGGTVTRLAAPKLEKTVVDTTGAGDAFVGAFAHALATGLDEWKAAKLGMACASSSVTREGTQTAFPDRDLCEMIAAGIASSP